jgi:predicted dehydrogenase
MAVYDDLADEPLRIYDRGVEGFNGGTRPYEQPLSYRYGDILSPYIRSAEALAVEDRHFVGCIQNGTVPESDGVSGLSVVAVLDAIDRAMRQATSVAVDYFGDSSGADRPSLSQAAD